MTDAAHTPPPALTAAREADIRGRLAQITPGKWYCEKPVPDFLPEWMVSSSHLNKFGTRFVAFEVETHADAQFIAAAPADVSDLLAELTRLRAELAELTRLVALYKTYAIGHALDNFMRTEESAFMSGGFLYRGRHWYAQELEVLQTLDIRSLSTDEMRAKFQFESYEHLYDNHYIAHKRGSDAKVYEITQAGIDMLQTWEAADDGR